MRKLCLTLILVLAPLAGCEKKQEAAPATSTKPKQSVEPNTPSQKPNTPSQKQGEPQRRLDTPPLKVPAQNAKTEADLEEKGENLSAEVCSAACTNAVTLSLASEKNAAIKEQLQAYGIDDCKAQCQKKGTKVQADCMTKATSTKELANCRL